MDTEVQSVYDFNIKTIDGQDISMETYQGKWLLIVNVASKCGMTPQYEGLQDLYEKYKDKGLVVMGFPCNQFAGQEPGTEESIMNGCVLTYNIGFPMFAKIKVNGKEADPLYKFLKEALPGLLSNMIKWNFTKFLIDPNGTPVKRYAPKDLPSTIDEDLSKLIG